MFELSASLLLLLLLLTGWLAGAAFWLFGNYSDGHRAGTVMKLGRKGFLFKSYEGELNPGMVLGDQSGAQVANVWDFSVPASDKETLAKLDSAMMSGHRAKLHYREKFVAVPVYKVDLAP